MALLTLALVVAGITARLVGVASMSLWLDEAVYANVVSGRDLGAYFRFPASNRPLGYLLASSWLVGWHNSELVLRLASLVVSLLSVLAIVPLSRMLFASRAFTLLSVFALTSSAWLVSFAKEFKPYGIEHGVVVLWLLLLAWYRRSARTSVLVMLAASLAIAPLFTHTPLFVAPFLTLVLVVTCWQRGSVRAAGAVAACAALGVVIAVLQFAWIGSVTSTVMFPGWEVNYFEPARDGALVAWFAARLVAMLASFVPLDPWTEATPAGRVFLGLCIAGWIAGVVRFVVRRELWLLGVLVGPLLPPTVLAVLARWPLGPERVNLFAITLLTLTVLLGWEWLLRREAARIAGALLFVALQLPVDLGVYARKDARFGLAQEEMAPLLELLAERERARIARGEPHAAIVLSQMSTYAVRYYARFSYARAHANEDFLHAQEMRWLTSRERDAVRDQVRARLERHGVIWIVLAHYGVAEEEGIGEVLADPAVTTFAKDEFPGVMLIGARLESRPGS